MDLNIKCHKAGAD